MTTSEPVNPSPAGESDPRHIIDIIKELRDDAFLLVQQEIALAKTEMSEKAGRVGKNLGVLVAGGVIGLLSGILLMTALTTGVAAILEAMGWEESAQWLAPLIVGILLALIGFGLVQKALATLKRESLVPQETIDSLKEDKQWIANKAT